MSDPAAAVPAETDLDMIVDALKSALPIAETIVAALFPAAAGAAAIAVKIAQGVAAGVPEAEALWAQFQSGTPPTQEQMDAYAAVEQTAYETLMADIKAKLAASTATVDPAA